MWLPAGEGMLSTSTVSLAGSMTLESASTKRDTRLTGLALVFDGQLPNLLNV